MNSIFEALRTNPFAAFAISMVLCFCSSALQRIQFAEIDKAQRLAMREYSWFNPIRYSWGITFIVLSTLAMWWPVTVVSYLLFNLVFLTFAKQIVMLFISGIKVVFK